MKHLDEVPIAIFRGMQKGADEAIEDMVKYMLEKDMCPVCMCYLIAEAAKDAAKKMEKSKGIRWHAETH